MNRIIKAVLASALAGAFAVPAFAAQTVQVDFIAPGPGFNGSFVATDRNGDGDITIDEISSFRNDALGAGTVVEFGDFNLATDVWTPAEPFPGETIYYSLTAGLSTYIEAVAPTSVSVRFLSSVPEPLEAPLMALGLGAIALASRKRGAARSK